MPFKKFKHMTQGCRHCALKKLTNLKKLFYAFYSGQNRFEKLGVWE